MPLGAAAALAAALCWTLASGLWRRLPTSLGAAPLNLLKNLIALAIQLPLLLLLPAELPASAALLLLLSGALGIGLGDSFYFAALRRLGTRRTLTFDAGGPAVTSLAGIVVLAEVPRPLQWAGIGLISLAVLLVARQAPPETPAPAGSMAGGALRGGGIPLALAALLCGSAGALLARGVLREYALPPLQAATLRLVGGTLLLLPLLPQLRWPGRRPRPPGRRWPLVLGATLLGTTLGIVLQQFALQRLAGGLAVALLATASVLAVPLARLEGDHPGWPGLLSAGLALAGFSLVVLGG
ncbi:MAG: EamA family transporter [Synechococcus sp.]